MEIKAVCAIRRELFMRFRACDIHGSGLCVERSYANFPMRQEEALQQLDRVQGAYGAAVGEGLSAIGEGEAWRR
jgi:hypothetical protein